MGGFSQRDRISTLSLPGGRSDPVLICNQNNLYTFGGYGYSITSTPGHLNELWVFNTTTLSWTLLGGSSINNAGSYIIPGEFPFNFPAARKSAFGWADSDGIWIFGGLINSSSNFMSILLIHQIVYLIYGDLPTLEYGVGNLALRQPMCKESLPEIHCTHRLEGLEVDFQFQADSLCLGDASLILVDYNFLVSKLKDQQFNDLWLFQSNKTTPIIASTSGIGLTSGTFTGVTSGTSVGSSLYTTGTISTSSTTGYNPNQLWVPDFFQATISVTGIIGDTWTGYLIKEIENDNWAVYGEITKYNCTY